MSRAPLRPTLYRQSARQVRLIADQLDQRCEPQTARELAALTATVNRLSAISRRLREAHA